MRKATSNAGFGRGWLVAASLAVTLAAFGCTTNRTAGNGQPTMVTPTMNSTDHVVTNGSSSGTEGNPPMTSSYMHQSDMGSRPRVDVDAQANLAAERGYQGILLGPSGAQGAQQGVTVVAGQTVSPALAVNPEPTLNSSISSPGGGAAITGGPIVPESASTGVTLGNGGLTATTAAVTAPGTTAATTGALAGSAAFSPVLMNSTPPPQPTGTVAPTLATIGATGTTALTTFGGTPATTGTTAANSTATNGTATTAMPAAAMPTLRVNSATANVASGIRVQTAANGGVLVTNIGTGGAAAGHH